MIKTINTAIPASSTAGLPVDTFDDPVNDNFTDPADIESLCEQGAYPVMTREGCRVDLAPFEPILDAYFKRSLRFVSPESRFQDSNPFFLTYESGYPQALREIEDRGGAYVGVSQSLSFTYAAWQGAAHAYALDINGLIPFGFVPMYGLLLCMARSRLELLSLMLGRPLPESFGFQITDSDLPSDLFQIIKIMPYDDEFAERVDETLATEIALRGPVSHALEIKHAVRDFMEKFRVEYSRSLNNDMEPLDALYLSDGEGRGGTLSSETTFQKERRFFMQGLMTGVAADLAGNGLAMISADMRARGIAAGAIYISNAERWILENVDYAIAHSEGMRRQDPLKRIANFYRNLSSLPGASDAMLISANAIVSTDSERLASHLKEAFSLERPDIEAAEVALEFFPMRMAAEAKIMRNANREMKLHLLVKHASYVKKLSERLRAAIESLMGIFEGVALDESASKMRIMQDPSLAKRFKPWELDLLMSNLKAMGIVKTTARKNPRAGS